MPIVVRAKKNESLHELIKKFKKAVSASDIVQISKDRRYYQKPSRLKATKVAQMRRLKKRFRSLKRMKNVSSLVIQKMNERLNA